MAVTAVALGLGGCDVMIVSSPFLTAADASKDLALRPGLWSDASCPSPPAKKGGCRAMLVGADSVAGLMDHQVIAALPPGAAAGWTAGQPYVLADGRPPVLQLLFPGLGGFAGKGPDMMTPDDANRPGFMFLGVRPMSRDASGRIDELEAWPVLCGPPGTPPSGQDAPKTPAAKMAAVFPTLTEHPFPGVIPAGISCRPRDREGLHEAARLSLRYAKKPIAHMRWVGETPPLASQPPGVSP
jgi:hypothetical protein